MQVYLPCVLGWKGSMHAHESDEPDPPCQGMNEPVSAFQLTLRSTPLCCPAGRLAAIKPTGLPAPSLPSCSVTEMTPSAPAGPSAEMQLSVDSCSSNSAAELQPSVQSMRSSSGDPPAVLVQVPPSVHSGSSSLAAVVLEVLPSVRSGGAPGRLPAGGFKCRPTTR